MSLRHLIRRTKKVRISNWLPVFACSLLLLGTAVWQTGCRKHQDAQPATDTSQQNSGSSVLAPRDEDSLKYYIHRLMLVTITEGADTVTKIPQYLWYKAVPTNIDPFSASYPKAEDLLNYIISFPQNPSDRYSFLDRTGQISSQIQNGQSGLGFSPGTPLSSGTTNGDMGFEVAPAQANNQIYWFVLYVYKNSSAGQQGVQRGWQLTAVNGATNFSTATLSDALYNSNSAQFTFKKPDGTSTTLTITATNYTLTPVLFDTVFYFGSKPVGYFVFNQFINVYDANGNPTETKNELDQIFTKFKSAGVKDVIVDERYNTGGSVTTVAYLDSLLAPASAAGQLMYSYVYNDRITAYLDQLSGFPQKVYFGNSTGGLQLDHVFFITSRNTVSASELTFNNLKPYMSVLTVGDTTYGKPVGFFQWSISDYDSLGRIQHLADLYDVNFQTLNASGQGSYFEGIPPNSLQPDYINLNWGDLRDANLQAIQNYILSGSFRQSASLFRSATASALYPRVSLFGTGMQLPSESYRFKGMVLFQSGRNSWRVK
ncbi:peptidase S41-like protein [Thermoflavifilum aggregans]|uniref:Peptidase S41-like protein n=1 Tax=Thermoflavifilum aggregans TaxID=454188 RepID=A0A2M9CRM9_9BACT|nr:S41 family peptidase [Thermoflavifilum aggregans]PJJ74596.1 peptidase S41-like protein [Thermoflavifilum aggregans]